MHINLTNLFFMKIFISHIHNTHIYKLIRNAVLGFHSKNCVFIYFTESKVSIRSLRWYFFLKAYKSHIVSHLEFYSRSSSHLCATNSLSTFIYITFFFIRIRSNSSNQLTIHKRICATLLPYCWMD